MDNFYQDIIFSHDLQGLRAFGTFKDPPADARFASKILKTTWGSSLVNKFHRYVQQTSTRGKLF